MLKRGLSSSALKDAFERKIASGELIPDPKQLRAVKLLSKLQSVLSTFDFASASASASASSPQPSTFAKGAFIHGSVGTGKSMLMDLFFDTPTGNVATKKRRVHFHAFMNDVHRRIHEAKHTTTTTTSPSSSSPSPSSTTTTTTTTSSTPKPKPFHIDLTKPNPIVQVGLTLSSEVNLLCFDEFQVTDIADAVILTQLLNTMYRSGTVIVATSNRRPSELYLGGLNRGYFLPAIEMIEERSVVFDMDSEVDYRIVDGQGGGQGGGMASSFFRKREDAESLFQSMGETKAKNIDVMFGRTLRIKRYTEAGAASFTFDELCGSELAAADYRSLAKEFNTIFLLDVPLLSLNSHNESRRFITLIDELYEQGVRIVIGCAADNGAKGIEELFDEGSKIDGGERTIENGDDVEGVKNGGWMDAKQSNGLVVSELASVKELRFAFQRAGSRLHEMTRLDK